MAKYKINLGDEQPEEQEKEKVNFQEIEVTLQGLSDKLQGINFIRKNNSVYLVAERDESILKNVLKDNYTYLHYLTEVEHSKVYLDYGHNRVLLTSSLLNRMTED